MPLRNLSIIILAAIVSLACYLRASRNRYVGSLAEAMNIISQEYVDDVDQRKLFEGAMDGMVGQLDEYSGYHPPDEYTQFQQDIDQQFVGIGIYIDLNAEKKQFTVLTPLPGTPAAEAGVKPGDVIVAVNGVATEGLSLKEVTNLIKGPAGSTVALELVHEGETTPVKLDVKRASIAVDSVLGDLRGPDGKWSYRLAESPKVGYIRILTFGERTADELRTALASFRQDGEGALGLILDLRGNEGGLLDAAVDVCDMFLDEGVIVRTVGRNNQERDREVATRGVEFSPQLPLVVMVDRYSASASEIVAACLQDHGRAVVIGQRSWGKGTVQNVVRMEGGQSAIRLTIARYFRPSGRNIHKSAGAEDSAEWGVRPDQGFETNLTDAEFLRYRRGRSQRDLLTSSGKLVWGVEGSAAASTPIDKSSPSPSTEPSSTSGPPLPPDEAATPASPPPDGKSALTDDPQLRQAAEYLLQRIDGQGTPRRASADRPPNAAARR